MSAYLRWKNDRVRVLVEVFVYRSIRGLNCAATNTNRKFPTVNRCFQRGWVAARSSQHGVVRNGQRGWLMVRMLFTHGGIRNGEDLVHELVHASTWVAGFLRKTGVLTAIKRKRFRDVVDNEVAAHIAGRLHRVLAKWVRSGYRWGEGGGRIYPVLPEKNIRRKYR